MTGESPLVRAEIVHYSRTVRNRYGRRNFPVTAKAPTSITTTGGLMKSGTPLKMLATAVEFAGSFNLAPAAEIQGGGTTMAQPLSPKLRMGTQNRLNKAHSHKNTRLHLHTGMRATQPYP